jgi:hypothetical protein
MELREEQFSVADGVDGSMDEAMRITKEGHVGIGKTDPDTRLHVLEDDPGANIDLITFDRTTGSPADGDSYDIIFNHENDNDQQEDFAQIRLIASDVSDGTEGGAIVSDGTEGGAIAISVADGVDGSMDEAMRITKEGHVGIGTTTPKGALNIDNTGEANGLGVYYDTYFLQTNDNTPTNIATISTESNKVYGIEVTFVAINTENSESAHFVRTNSFKNFGGAANTIIGYYNYQLMAKDDANWAASVTLSGTNIVVQVTGDANDVVNWQATVKLNVIGY